MNKLSFVLSLALLCTGAQADFVIDDFSDGATVLGNGSDTGTLGADATGDYTYRLIGVGLGSSLTAGGNDSTATVLNAGGSVEVEYNLGSSIDLHSSGNFPGAPLVLRGGDHHRADPGEPDAARQVRPRGNAGRIGEFL